MEDLLYQLQAQLETKDPHMIDPVEFGEIKGAVASLQTQVTDIKGQLASISAKQDVVINQLSEAKGGWKIMMLLGGSAGALGAGLATLFGKGAP
jgi:hypothetical protein